MASANTPGQNHLENMTIPKSLLLFIRSSSRLRILGMCSLMTLVVFLTFARSLGYEFVNFDDSEYFSSNYHVKTGLTWDGLGWAFRTGHASNWHPLTWLSLMLDAQLFGPGPAGPHLTNVTLHAANAVLLFLLLRYLMGVVWPSAFVAAVFALHPLRVESVVWVAERKDVLSGLFFMLTLLMYTRYAQGGAESRVSGVKWLRSRHYWLTILFLALGLMSKPMLVTVPFLLLLLDYWPLRRLDFSTRHSRRSTIMRLMLEKLPFIFLSVASCVATILVQLKAIKPMIALPLTLRCDNALVSYVTYCGQMVWPQNLAMYYPYRFDAPAWQTAGAGALLLSITLLAFSAWRR
jgi:hypothetical protein